MTGNIFKGQVQDTLFNIVSTVTQQNIHLLGMMTEAITPRSSRTVFWRSRMPSMFLAP